jgi:hypothetical protein
MLIGSSYFTSKSMGIDPAYGRSAFGIVVTQWVNDHIQILHAKEYHRPDYNEMLSVVYELMSKYKVVIMIVWILWSLSTHYQHSSPHIMRLIYVNRGKIYTFQR